jgi:mannitol-1-phosphate/altronate dehydrogenase
LFLFTKELSHMSVSTKKKTFLGFGLGAVQSGLMLFEAYKSNNFSRFVIVEVNPDLVKDIRSNHCTMTINTATKKGILKSIISGFEIYNPTDERDQSAIASAIHDADEMATAIPSTDFYDLGDNSLARSLARNVNSKKPQIVYASENNNYAAEILLEKIKTYAVNGALSQFQTINTVIGKMGGVIQDDMTVQELGLDRITPESKTAVLVEEFNHIIVSKIHLPNFQRGIEVFQEKDDLLPFEEAKLFGHNAVHSMLGFFAALRGYTFMSEIRNDPKLYEYGVRAFMGESGAFLLDKYKKFDDPLFTREGFTFYATDLLERMTNPYLRDEVQRICRDPLRKLDYDDRFFGTIRGALRHGVRPTILPKAVIAAICYIIKSKVDTGFPYPDSVEELSADTVKSIVKALWKNKPLDDIDNEILNLVAGQFDEFCEEFVRSSTCRGRGEPTDS